MADLPAFRVVPSCPSAWTVGTHAAFPLRDLLFLPSLWSRAQVELCVAELTRWARHELEQERFEKSARHARDALVAAKTLGRRSEEAYAPALLVAVARKQCDQETIATEEEALAALRAGELSAPCRALLASIAPSA